MTTTYRSRVKLDLGQVPNGISDDILYRELLDIHNAIEQLADRVGGGGIVLTTPAAQSDLGAGWITIEDWTANSLADPKYVTQEFALDGFRFNVAETYVVSINITLIHNIVSGSSRILGVRLFNVDKATAFAATEVATPRAVDITNINLSGLLFEIPEEQAGDLFVIQLGGGGTYTSVSVNNSAFSAVILK